MLSAFKSFIFGGVFRIILLFAFLILVPSIFKKFPGKFVFNQYKKFQTTEFRIHLKDINMSYVFFGHGENSCLESNILIATMSRPNEKSLRMGIRNSWQKHLPSTYAHKFFVGSTSDKLLENDLKNESSVFGDIVFTEIVDTYGNLTLKMNYIYQWQQAFCPKAEYFLRADDDTVLDVSRFDYWLNKEFKLVSKYLKDLAIFGHLVPNGTIPQRDLNSKWYVSNEAYNDSYYPQYVGGSSYLATTKAVQLMLEEAKNHKYFFIDDSFYTGVCAEAIGITRIDVRKHFVSGNPLNSWNHECDTNSTPLMFSLFDENGEIEKVQDGYAIALKMLKELKC